MSNTQSTRLWDKALNILITITVIVTPLIFVTNTNELFEFPKMFLLHFLGSTIIALFVTKQIITPKKLSLPNRWIALFLAANIAAAVFSVHPYTSFWGYYTRFNDGLLSTLIFFGLYLVILNTETSQNLMLTLIPMGIYGVYQHFQGITRVYSTIGQPNWLAAFIGMVLPTVIYNFTVLEKTKPLYKVVIFTVYILGFTTLWYTYSLSGILGFAVGMLVFTLLNKKLLRENKKALRYGIIIIATLVLSLTNLGIFKNRLEDAVIDLQNFVSQETTAYAQEAMGHNISDPGFIRFGVWKGTLNLITASWKNLILGTGPETFPYTFQQYRPAQLNYSSEWDFVMNKPHNYYLETLAELGIAGTIPYIGLIIYTLRKKDPIITPSLVVLYVTNIFGWPTVATSLLFWYFLAVLEKEA